MRGVTDSLLRRSPRPALRRVAPGVVLALVASCSFDLGDGGCLPPADGPGGSGGELGKSYFAYRCLNVADPCCFERACEDGDGCPLPPAIAVGARFGVDCTTPGGSDLRVTSASPALLSPEDEAFVAQAAGRVALLARITSRDVVDLVHVVVEEPEDILLESRPAEGPGWTRTDALDLVLGDVVALRAANRGANGTTLCGAQEDAYWWLSGSGVVEWTEAPWTQQHAIRADREGQDTVSIRLGGWIAEVPVTVRRPPCTEVCSLDDPTPCCPDAFGAARVCVAQPGADPACVRACVTSEDCHWHHRCDPAGYCVPRTCDALDRPCAIDDLPEGSTTGYCVALVPRDAPGRALGICVEPGARWPGEACAVPADPLVQDRSWPGCLDGPCWPDPPGSGVGTCQSFCDAERILDAALQAGDATDVAWPCPFYRDCLSLAHLSADTGLREPRYGICLPDRTLAPEAGVTSCDLAGGQVVDAPGTTCASVLEDALVGCGPTLDPETGEASLGTVVGTCRSDPWGRGGPPDRRVWDDCTDATAICPPSTWCHAEGGDAAAPRCLPLCDTRSAVTGIDRCVDLVLAANPEVTLPATPLCVSLSTLLGDPGLEDAFPTRLGLCQLGEWAP